MITTVCLADTLDGTYDYFRELLLKKVEQGDMVNTGHWQALRDVPHVRSYELRHVILQAPVRPTPGSWASFCRPNLPWAEDHFKERVSGRPLNPGDEYKNWPWYAGGVEDHKPEGQFSHTYMERFWPKWANGGRPAWGVMAEIEHRGIRFDLGDFDDLVKLLDRDPHTRQAYLPIWFPEDLAASLENERVPCSLGYHLMLRDDKLHCMYAIRSCDIVRYLRDDLYLAGRLIQEVIERVVKRRDIEEDPVWDFVTPGDLVMTIGSLHCFEGDVPKIKREHEERLSAARSA